MMPDRDGMVCDFWFFGRLFETGASGLKVAKFGR